MSKLTKELRDAVALATTEPSFSKQAKLLVDVVKRLPVVLAEHERFEREAEAGRVFVGKMWSLNDSGDCGKWIEEDLLAYSKACEPKEY